jgi:hypothetical protein
MIIKKYIWKILLIIYILIIILSISQYGKIQPEFTGQYYHVIGMGVGGLTPLILGYKIGENSIIKNTKHINKIWKSFSYIYILIVLFFTSMSYFEIGTYYPSYIVDYPIVIILLTSTIIPLIIGYKTGLIYAKQITL